MSFQHRAQPPSWKLGFSVRVSIPQTDCLPCEYHILSPTNYISVFQSLESPAPVRGGRQFGYGSAGKLYIKIKLNIIPKMSAIGCLTSCIAFRNITHAATRSFRSIKNFLQTFAFLARFDVQHRRQ